jgi:tRNA(Arg) A34 adenosine deaminase TadA
MRAAIVVARQGIQLGQSPFGAVIATADGRPVCAEHNKVRADSDPTAHAEIEAIRRACRLLDRIDLSGHVIATTCEPCPMCAAAIHWARLDLVIYGASIADVAQLGFKEMFVSCQSLYQMGGSNVRTMDGVLRAECQALFQDWRSGPGPDPY